MPDDHHHNRPRARPARVHQCRTARARQVPSRVPRPDTRGVRAGPAPVHRLGAGISRCPCSPSAAPTSKASPGTWKPRDAPAPPSPGGCAPSPGSANTRSKKNSSSIPRLPMSGGRGWIMSRTPPPGPQRARRPAGGCRARPAAGARADLLAGPEQPAGLRGHRRRYRATGPGARAAQGNPGRTRREDPPPLVADLDCAVRGSDPFLRVCLGSSVMVSPPRRGSARHGPTSLRRGPSAGRRGQYGRTAAEVSNASWPS